MKFIVGLGNPGKEYHNTRHNLGFMVLDYIADIENFKFNKIKFKSIIGEININGEKCIFIKPMTFMNRSGQAIREIVDFYKLELDDLLVIYDDIDIPLGNIRIRKEGSAGSHNGMKDILYHLKTDAFARLRIGLGNQKEMNLRDYVLFPFSKDEIPVIKDSIELASDAVKMFLKEGVDKAMNIYNRKK